MCDKCSNHGNDHKDRKNECGKCYKPKCYSQKCCDPCKKCPEFNGEAGCIGVITVYRCKGQDLYVVPKILECNGVQILGQCIECVNGKTRIKYALDQVVKAICSLRECSISATGDKALLVHFDSGSESNSTHQNLLQQFDCRCIKVLSIFTRNNNPNSDLGECGDHIIELEPCDLQAALCFLNGDKPGHHDDDGKDHE